MKDNWKVAYMDTAERFAQESYAVRLQVGAIVVKDDRIISIGINGMPSGWENVCEHRIYLRDDYEHMASLSVAQRKSMYPYKDEIGRYCLKSKDEVLHAETNAISKLAKSGESGDGAAIFITHSPCIDCAKALYQAGIKEVYYRNDYRSSDGIKFLEKCHIPVEKV